MKTDINIDFNITIEEADIMKIAGLVMNVPKVKKKDTNIKIKTNLK